MKRFLLFAGARYYPGGGWEDFKGSFDSHKEAEQYSLSLELSEEYYGYWAHWVDIETSEKRILVD